MAEYCFGIDIGGTAVKCGLFRMDGTLIEKWEFPTCKECHGERILPDIACAVREKMQQYGLGREDVAGIGIGIPGPVNEQGETACAVNLSWGYKNAPHELSMLTDLPVKAGNDANVAALGETWKGAAEGVKNAIMITLGTGVGGGMIVNGKILCGVHGAGGEIGHAAMNREETETCNCGNRGCLEQIASATGIVRIARKVLESSAEAGSLGTIENLTAKDVLDAFGAGDAVAVRVMEQVGEVLGNALAIFSCVLDPEIIIIGGGVSQAGQPLLDCIQKYYQKYAFSLCKDIPIVVAALGNDAGVYGGACMVLREICEQQ